MGDRDCSTQRRHQKIIEEAPSGIPDKVKKQMHEVSKELCKAIGYRGAGTIEFLFQDDKFYFLEMNTRLQVEHTVTEMIFGINLVRSQILTAMKQPAFLKDQDFSIRGHSLQCRICAEDPSNQFVPSIGTLLGCQWPQGVGIRVDTGFQQGDSISLQYDSLVAKIITWDSNRDRNIQKMIRALDQTIIFGVTTNIPFLKHILSHKTFMDDQIKIDSVEKSLFPDWKPKEFPLNDDFMNHLFKTSKDFVSKNKAKNF